MPPTDEDHVNWVDEYYREDEFETRVRGYNNQNDQHGKRMPHFRNQNNINNGGYFYGPRNNDRQYMQQYGGNYN